MLNVKIWVIVSVKSIAGHEINIFFSNNLNDFTVQKLSMYTIAGWWLQSCSVNYINIQSNVFSIVQPYKLCIIFWNMKTDSVATSKPLWHLL